MQNHTLIKIVAGMIILLATALDADVPDTCRQEPWVVNGVVHAIGAGGNRVYISGEFDYVGPYTGSAVPLDASTGEALPVFPKINGTVCAILADGSGGWFVGGSFTYVGMLPRNNIAHILANGSVDPSWDPNAAGEVYGLALSGNTLYVCGSFNSIGGQYRSRIAALDVATGNATSWAPNANRPVYVIVPNGTIVYAGGLFANIGGQPRNAIAALDATTGNATTWNPNVKCGYNGANTPPSVRALAISGSTVYVGGSFDTINGQPRSKIAALDAVTGKAAAWNPDARIWTGNPAVYALSVSGSVVYAGGYFDSIGGQRRKFIAALDPTTGNATTWNPEVFGYILSKVMNITVSGTTIYVGGKFSGVGDQYRNNIAAVDATTGKATAWNPRAGDWVEAIAVSGTTVYAGGGFESMGGIECQNFAALDAITGRALDWNIKPDANDIIYSILVRDTTVYIGGIFRILNGYSRDGIGALNAITGQPTSWNPIMSFTVTGTYKAQVSGLTPSGNTIYACGRFDTIGGQPRQNIAALDATTGNATAWNPQPDDMVYSIVVSGSTVYAGGCFDIIGGQPRRCIAALDATTGNATAWNPNSDGMIEALTISDNTVYAGGWFNSIGGQPRSRIAALDITTGNATTWNPGSDAPPLTALAVTGNTVYAGGKFDSIGGQFRRRVAALDATTGNATAWDPKLGRGYPDDNDNVFTLATSGTTLYVGGGFRSTKERRAGLVRSYFAQYGAFVPVPSLVSPANKATGQPLSLALEWKAVSRASTYRVQLSKYADFTTTVIDDSTVPSVSKATGPLSPDTTYYWRVYAQNADGTSGWSDVWSFTTTPNIGIITNSQFKIVTWGIYGRSIRYSLPDVRHVVIRLYGINGQLKAVVVNRQQAAGCYTLNLRRCTLAAGPYLVVFKAGDFQREKMLFMMK